LIVDGAGENFFARARFARDEDGGARGRNLIEQLEDGLHLLGAPDDAAIHAAPHRAPERLSFLFLAPTLDPGGDGGGHLLVLERLADAAERAALPRGHRRIERRISRDHHDDGFRVRLLNLFERAKSAHAGHRNV
jgi:hypothetical protein